MGGQFFLKWKWAVRFINESIVLPSTVLLQWRHHFQVAPSIPPAAFVFCLTGQQFATDLQQDRNSTSGRLLRSCCLMLCSSEVLRHKIVNGSPQKDRINMYVVCMVLQFRNLWERCFLCLGVISGLLSNCLRESYAILYLFWIIWTVGYGSENVG